MAEVSADPDVFFCPYRGVLLKKRIAGVPGLRESDIIDWHRPGGLSLQRMQVRQQMLRYMQQ